MKYIDEHLSPTNLQLLNAWIDRRESGQKYVDVRRAVDREWWERQQAMRRHIKKPSPLEPYQSAYQNQLLSQAAIQQQANINSLASLFQGQR